VAVPALSARQFCVGEEAGQADANTEKNLENGYHADGSRSGLPSFARHPACDEVEQAEADKQDTESCRYDFPSVLWQVAQQGRRRRLAALVAGAGSSVSSQHTMLSTRPAEPPAA
jgi:hypothetical protein